ncbi:MAG: DUF4097 family beta strand repeat protein [Acidobacteria bacterium]|nr:DUF4097 family beta strand repeat protein [Acidobacteriota bacterium]
MKPSLMKVTVVAALCVLLAGKALAASDRAVEGSFERSLSVTGAVDLDVKTGSGDIDIRTGNASNVHIRGRIRVNSWRLSADEAERRVRYLESNPPIEQNGNTVRVGHIEDPSLRRNVSISYEIVVPTATRVTAGTGSGNSTIAGVEGPVRTETGSGNLKITSVGDTLRANTGSGDIEIASARGSVYAQTGSGNIQAFEISGGFVASTGSGNVKLRQVASGSVSVETGSGDVEVSGAQASLVLHTGSGNISADGAPSGEWKLEAGSGNITLRLPAQAAFDLNAHTGSGNIESDHPVTVQGKMNRHELRGKVRGGGTRLEASTGSGDIRIL